MSDSETQVIEILAAWRAGQERGEILTPDEVIARHPEVAEDLREAFAAATVLEQSIDFGAILPPAVGASSDGIRTLGDFRILCEIGRGAMGVVYEAEQVSMHRRVALKVLYPSVTLAPKAIERFRREAQATGRLHHTNIVAVYGLGSDADTWYYAMECVDGRPLNQVLEDLRNLEGGRPEPSADAPSTGLSTSTGRREEYVRVARAFSRLADGLATAHAQGVVHRDVKPSNILLASDGTLKLLDFGLAHIHEEATALTASGEVVGTPAYMSPEQARAGEVDARTDVYGLGATLYEVLTHRPPVEGSDVAEVVRRLLSREPVPPRRWNRRIPHDLETIVMKAMDRDPGRRYAAAADMARDLLVFAEGGAILARRIGPVGRAWRGVKRNPVRSGLVAGLVLLAGALGWLGMRHADQRERAKLAEARSLLEQAHLSVLKSVRQFGRDGMAHVPKEVAEKAMALTRRARDLAPERFEPHYDIAIWGPSLEERLRHLHEALRHGLGERLYHLTRGQFLLWDGRRKDAQEALAAAMALPDDGNAMSAKAEGDLYLAAGRRKDAIARYTLALQRGETGPSLHVARASAREAEGDLHGALEDLAGLLDDSSMSATFVQGRIASLWSRLGEAERAEEAFEKALAASRADGSVEAWRSVCSACLDGGEYPWVDRACEEALRSHPNDLELMGLQYDSLYRRGRASDALRCADRMVERAPDNAVAHINRAAALMSQELMQVAEESARRALALDPEVEGGAFILAAVLAQQGKAEEGLGVIRDHAKAHPEDHHAQHNLAEVLCNQSRFEEALPALELAIRLDPLCGRARERRVWVLKNLRRFEDGLKDADLAIAALGPRADIHVEKGRILGILGRDVEALAEFDLAVGIDAQHADAHVAMAFRLAHMGRHAPALEAVQRAIDSAPEWAQARQMRATLLQHAGQHEKALAAAEELLARDPLDPVAHEIRAYSLHQLSRTQEALDAIETTAATLDDLPKSMRILKAEFLIRLGRFEDALRALGTPSTSAGSHEASTRGVVLALLNREAEALHIVEDLEARFSDDFEASCARVRILRHLGRTEDARRVARAATEKPPPDGNTVNLALLAALAGRGDLAGSTLLRLSQSPTSSEREYTIACVYALLGDIDKAVARLSSAIDGGWRVSAKVPPDPDFAALEGDPRYVALREKMLIR